jgi:HSP20 family protein
MTTLVKRNRSLFPSVVQDFFNSDRLFSPSILDYEGNLPGFNTALTIPSVNVIETEKEYKIELAAPGMERKDFKVEIDKNGILSIKAEKEEEKKEEEKNWLRKEFSYTRFERSFNLPENLITDKIDAKYEHGILKLVLPKKEVSITKQNKEIKVL